MHDRLLAWTTSVIDQSSTNVTIDGRLLIAQLRHGSEWMTRYVDASNVALDSRNAAPRAEAGRVANSWLDALAVIAHESAKGTRTVPETIECELRGE